MTPASLLAAIAAAAVALAPATPVRHGLPGFPRIATPTDAAGRRINRALDRLDAHVRAAARDCLTGAINPASWTRRIAVPMRGPAFLSYYVTDEIDCGGAHPDEEHSALVFDLRSGTPVDWRALLPARLTGTLALSEGADGVKVVTLASRRLTALYRDRYDPARTGDPRDCRNLPDADEPDAATPMVAWLDARRGGLALQYDLNHASQTCSEAVVLPIALLRREGASPRLLAALIAAHAHR